jgi:hypothetical protein
MGGKSSRCDALKLAAAAILEQFRPLLDTHTSIRAVHLELRIRAQDSVIHTVSLSPRFETHPEEYASR